MSILPKASRPGDRSTGDGVAPANAGKHFPKRIEDAAHRCTYVVDVVIVDVRVEHFALSRRMFAVSFSVDAEVTVMFRIGEAVMFLQPVDLRFADRRNLAFVGIKPGETFRSRSIASS